MGKKRQHRPEKHKQDLGAQMDDPNAAGVRVSSRTCMAVCVCIAAAVVCSRCLCTVDSCKYIPT